MGEFSEEYLEGLGDRLENKIENAVDKYYLGVITNISYFEKRIFIEADGKVIKEGTKRSEFYKSQYRMIKKWADKWKKIMERAGRIRIAERFDFLYENNCINDKAYEINEICMTGKHNGKKIEDLNLYRGEGRISEEQLCQYLLKAGESLECEKEKEEKEEEEKKEQEREKEICKNKENCKDGCRELVQGLIKNKELLTISRKDYEYMIVQAFMELEDERSKLLINLKEKVYNLLIKSPCENDIKNLFDLRKRDRPECSVIEAGKKSSKMKQDNEDETDEEIINEEGV